MLTLARAACADQGPERWQTTDHRLGSEPISGVVFPVAPGSRVDGRRGPSRPRELGRLFVFARHAESSANVAGVISSDPAGSEALTARGIAQARQLGAQLANLDIDLAVCSRLVRTQQTLDVALRGRAVPVRIDAGFDEVWAGDFDGQPIEAYWSWEEHHAESERLPRGESVDEALRRYANALRRLLSRTEPVTLLVIHELALRHIAAAATTSSSPSSQASIANALPYLFEERAIERAAADLEESLQSDLAEHGRGAPTCERGDTLTATGGGVLPCP